MRMKKYFLCLVASLSAIVSVGFTKSILVQSSDCAMYLYWFKVKNSVFAGCDESNYFLDNPPELNWNYYPDAFEVVQGNDLSAEYSFGCYDSGDFCCAVGFELWDIELGYDGKWKPKPFAAPMCVIRRD